MSDTETYLCLKKIEDKFEWRTWAYEIPYLKFNPEWEITAVPPFDGAIIRYYIKYKTAFLSVYLDCYDMLGIYGKPYWEVYPYNEDIFRCDMKNTKALMKAIKKGLENQLKKGEKR